MKFGKRSRSLQLLSKQNHSQRDLDEGKLVELLNNHWSKASFGYKIHEDLRSQTSVAEMLRSELQQDWYDIISKQ